MKRLGGCVLWTSVLVCLALGRGNAALAGSPPKEEKPPVDFTMQLLRSASLIEINLVDRKEFLTWGKHVVDGLKTYSAEAGPNQHVLAQVTFRPGGEPEFTVMGSPKLKPESKAAILGLLKARKIPAVKFQEIWLRFVSGKAGERLPQRLARFPGLESPRERERKAFLARNTAGQYEALRSWARKEALPVIAEFAAGVDPKFKGVRNVGSMLKKADYTKPLDVAAMTERNPDFWRGIMEMSPGNPMVVSARVFLLVAEGKLDRAKRLLFFVRPFAEKDNGATELLEQLHRRLEAFYAKLHEEVGRGIKLHDQGKHQAALECYRAVLKAYPHSAWTRYEIYHTRFTMAKAAGAGDADKPDWQAAAKSIYDSYPLYGSQYQASNGEEAYRLLRRMQSRELFKDLKKYGADMAEFAEIAADLGEHGTSALLRWRMLTSVKMAGKRQREVLANFLYDLEQLGVKSIRKNFRGDHQKDFKRIAAERRERMEKNAAYRAMMKKK